MKFAMNGALTIGTLDGANIEILAEVGAENIFIFGLTRDDIQTLGASGSYRPRELCARTRCEADLRRVRLRTCSVRTSRGCFVGSTSRILDHGDFYFHVADLPAYIDQQHKVSEAFSRPAAWATKAILNVARIGRFSSDRTVAEYARDIWRIDRVEG